MDASKVIRQLEKEAEIGRAVMDAISKIKSKHAPRRKGNEVDEEEHEKKPRTKRTPSKSAGAAGKSKPPVPQAI